MQYVMSFLEGIITFISPCLLPMLPVYLSYFAGGKVENNRKQTLQNAFGFVVGFTIIFILLGAFAGSIGMILKQYSRIFEIAFGIIMILFGLNFMEVLTIKRLNQTSKKKIDTRNLTFARSILFGIIFSITWTPCVGTFLGSALMLATTTTHIIESILMLFCYSMGLAIPFLISAMLIHKLKTTFKFIKKHYQTINRICRNIFNWNWNINDNRIYEAIFINIIEVKEKYMKEIVKYIIYVAVFIVVIVLLNIRIPFFK